jgi:S1-C subfamily serine protease
VLSGSGNFVFRSDCVDGARLVELNPALGEYFGATRGVLVTEVAEDSPLGLVAGDIILSVSGRTVEAPEDVGRILASFRSDEVVTLRVRRKGQEIEVRGRRRE